MRTHWQQHTHQVCDTHNAFPTTASTTWSIASYLLFFCPIYFLLWKECMHNWPPSGFRILRGRESGHAGSCESPTRSQPFVCSRLWQTGTNPLTSPLPHGRLPNASTLNRGTHAHITSQLCELFRRSCGKKFVQSRPYQDAQSK